MFAKAYIKMQFEHLALHVKYINNLMKYGKLQDNHIALLNEHITLQEEHIALREAHLQLQIKYHVLLDLTGAG